MAHSAKPDRGRGQGTPGVVARMVKLPGDLSWVQRFCAPVKHDRALHVWLRKLADQ